MPETHINAFYTDLVTAKQEAAVAAQKVVLLEEQIRAKGGEVPGEETNAPEASPEDTANSEDVSAAEAKPLNRLNRAELNTVAAKAGVKKPESLATNKDVIAAIQGAE